MFVLFGELRKKQQLKKVQDLGIGVGLNCSSELTKALGGQIRLVSSIKGRTEFEIKIPIKNNQESSEIIQI